MNWLNQKSGIFSFILFVIVIPLLCGALWFIGALADLDPLIAFAEMFAKLYIIGMICTAIAICAIAFFMHASKKAGVHSSALEQEQKDLQQLQSVFHEAKALNKKLKGQIESLQGQVSSIESRYSAEKGITLAVAKRLLADSVKNIERKITPTNYATSHKQLENVFEYCKKVGLEIPEKDRKEELESLKRIYKEVVRKDFQKKEQARIRAQIREEEREAAAREREIKHLENERAAIEKALERALGKAKDEHDAEVERLRAMLTEAEEKSKRAVSQAQLTKSGHVYVISNLGSFGENVFKIGMTRRLEPMDRVQELGDASVPFSFDVHMMISCDDAPTLENALHKELHVKRLNRVNMRKEFFSIDIETIRKIVESHHGTVDYVAEPEALEYYESQNMDEEDYAFVSKELLGIEEQLAKSALSE